MVEIITNHSNTRQVHQFQNTCANEFTQEYRLASIICDVPKCRLFKPVRTALLSHDNILNHKEVASHVPEYFQNQAVLVVCYNYTTTIALKIFNYKRHCTTLTLRNT